MPTFTFDGPEELYYPTLSLTAVPGEVADLPEAPDALWKPTTAPTGAPAAPVSTTQE